MAMMLVASCASTGPGATSTPTAGCASDDTGSVIASSPEPAPSEAGAYTPFVYEPEFPGQLTPVEARECRNEVVAAGQDPAADWVLVLSRTESDDDLTIALRDDATVRVGCRLSEAVVSRPVAAPIATDDAGIRHQCGSVAGYDFTGWTVVSSMAAAFGVEAVLASTNGYTAFCSLQPNGWDSGSGQAVTMPTSSDVRLGRRSHGYEFPGDAGFHGSALSLKTERTPIEGQLWWGSGSLYDSAGEPAVDAHRITLTFSGITGKFIVPVARGRWAARIHLPEATGPLNGYRAVIEDESGDVLGQHTSSPS